MNGECWMEMDLYWFQGDGPERRAAELIQRVKPLWLRCPTARKGLSLCIGWLFDSILGWNGRLDDVIPTCQAPTYEPWTYARLAELIRVLKSEAARQGIDDLNVGLMTIGVASMEVNDYEGFSGRTEQVQHKVRYHIASPWLKAHPEVRDPRFDTFYFGAQVRTTDDEAVCREPAPTFAEFFADKLCGLAEATGLDAIVLRDAIFSPAYVRGNRRGRYVDPAASREWNQSLQQLLARIKANRPQLITIGYSSGISPIEEWRSHGFDLAELASTGNLDLWITQTWGSAWQDYWPQNSSGFTFQLTNVLTNLAMLEPTPCRHVFLIEAFDAWEPWDAIHQYPSKVAWEIWAYSHASMLRGDGTTSRSSGFYLSWLNRREELLPLQTVGWLETMLNACADDLAQDPRPLGPVLIYDRAGTKQSIERPTEISRGEELDDWLALLMKYGLPLLSVTRAEYAPMTTADAYVVPTVIRPSLSSWIGDCADKGTRLLFMGEVAQLPEQVRAAMGIEIESALVTSLLPTAATVVSSELAEQIGTGGLVLNQRRRTMARSAMWEPMIETLGGPVLSRHKNLPYWIWETPEWGTPLELNVTVKTVQSPQTYEAIVKAWGSIPWGAAAVQWTNQDSQRPVCFLGWQDKSGRTSVLLANLEAGLFGNSQNCAKGTLTAAGIRQREIAQHTAFSPARITRTDSSCAAAIVSLAAHRIAFILLT